MKKSLIFALALMLVLAFASSAMAAQVLSGNSYMATTETALTLPGGGSGTTVDRVYTNNKFFADGKTNYPFEIYLPNELNPGAYRIHSNYSKNTDACASCHSTHTAVNSMLLQWYTAYDTCMACHDGTVTTTYDVARGIVGMVGGKNVPAAGGMFGVTGSETSLSTHNVSGAMDNAAAPGGSTIARNFKDGVATDWALEFSCTACHTPHGEGGNARILKGDVNGQATIEATRRTFNIAPTGDINDTNGMSPTNATTPTVVGTLVYLNGIANGFEIQGKNYYSVKPQTDADRLVYNVGEGYMLSSVKVYVYSAGSAGTWKEDKTNFKIDNQLGYTRAIWMATGAAPAQTSVKIVGTPIIKVVMDVKNYLNKDNVGASVAERVYHISGINQFCGACHTDYNTASFEVYNANYDATLAAGKGDGGRLSSAPKFETGAYSKAHRHSVGRKGSLLPGIVEGIEFPKGDYNTKIATRLTDSKATENTVLGCLGCHVAHGTSQDYWNMTLVDTRIQGASGDVWTSDETKEIAGSSALKRQPNMGICLNCHNKQTSAIGNAANSSGGVPTAFVNALPPYTTDLGQTGATFVGSENCKPCHAEQVESYRETAHSKMVTFTTAAEKDSWYAKLVDEGYTNGNDANGYWVEQKEAITGYVYKFYKQDFALNVSWNKNTVIAVCYDAATSSYGKLCVLYENGPLKEEFENYGCITCHNTPKEVATNVWADFQSKLAAGTLEMGIQCETSGCHGPGSKHVASPSAKNIFNPGTLSIKEQSGYSFINSKGKIDTSLSKSCGLCHGSSGHNGEFWNGNKPKGFTTAGPSRMYTAGVLSCITCHTPHSNKVQDISRNGLDKADLQLKMPVRALCNGCHENRIIPVNNDNGKLRFDQYLPLKQSGMPSHLFDGQGYTNIDTTLLVKDGLVDPNGPAEEHRAE